MKKFFIILVASFFIFFIFNEDVNAQELKATSTILELTGSGNWALTTNAYYAYAFYTGDIGEIYSLSFKVFSKSGTGCDLSVDILDSLFFNTSTAYLCQGDIPDAQLIAGATSTIIFSNCKTPTNKFIHFSIRKGSATCFLNLYNTYYQKTNPRYNYIMQYLDQGAYNQITNGSDFITYESLLMEGNLIATTTEEEPPICEEVATTTACELILNNDISKIYGCKNIYGSSTTAPIGTEQLFFEIPAVLYFFVFSIIFICIILLFYFLTR
jgi:hypothetical protein